MMTITLLFMALAFQSTLGLKHADLHLHMDEMEMDHYFGTNDHEEMADYEVVQIRKRSDSGGLEKRSGHSNLNYGFQAFGSDYDFDLVRNKRILPATAVIVSHDEDGELFHGVGEDRKNYDCHYTSMADGVVANLAVCDNQNGKDQVQGMVFTSTHVLEIHPLTNKLETIIRSYDKNETQATYSLVTKRPVQSAGEQMQKRFNIDPAKITKRSPNGDIQLHIELAVFIDNSLYRRYMNFYGSRTEFINFIICYISGISSLYQVPSFGNYRGEIVIVRIDMNSHELNFSDNVQVAYDDFCKYQYDLLVRAGTSDSDAGHWDMGLLLVRHDLLMGSSTTVMGLAYVGGVCTSRYSCVIGELGTFRANGNSYPSTGMGSVFVTGHELGHNLGMNHDDDRNNPWRKNCDKTQYIMAPKRGYEDKNSWSPCTREKIKEQYQEGKLDCLKDSPISGDGLEIPSTPPGIKMDAHDQCVNFGLDNTAVALNVNDPSVCSSVICKNRDHMEGTKTAPALEGTVCGHNKWCNDGRCTPNPSFDASPTPSWSEWSNPPCQSGCIADAKGSKIRTRTCSSSSGVCPGKDKAFDFCDDSAVCSSRRSPQDVAAEICATFVPYLSGIELKSDSGTQIPLMPNNPDQELDTPCAAYCEKVGGGWYTAVTDSAVKNHVNVFFPEGTYCGTVNGVDHYCQKDLCFPENVRIPRSGMVDVNMNYNDVNDDKEPVDMPDGLEIPQP